MSTKTVPLPDVTDNSKRISWMALALTPGLGPTRARRLVEFFGGVEGVFQVSLTELESAGLPAAAAQSLGTGKSLDSPTTKPERPRALACTSFA